MAGIGAALLVWSTACVLSHPTAPPAGGEAPVDFTASVAPVFRLIINPVLIDSPSRLLVVRLMLATTGQSYYAFALTDLSIAPPGGTRARVFDPPRARELLRRTTLAEADMSYLTQDGYVAGGLSSDVRDALDAMVRNDLLDTGTFGPGQALEGYVVIDTEQSLMSLDGAAVEVLARRVGDDVTARYAAQVASAPRPEVR